MLDDNLQFSSLPKSIELLFENDRLDVMKILCLTYAVSIKSKRYVSISEILFYFALVNYNLIQIFENTDYNTSPNLYFRFQERFKPLLITMVNLGLVEIKANISTKAEDIKVRVTKYGKVFFEEKNTLFFKKLQDRYLEVFDSVPYTIENLRRLREGKR
ncbi:hypothetical protein [Paenibacillus lactis]|uniref:Uncharacterized protein n=1 Tax=Paenibacillus lactis 154 TaxID=743719 RepID=G4HD59_9BACL|nr:hypothetical protein [Paenibacillus lactis]EHB65985.1 hypothetical protein PaelaDRAFT_1912 [Paenibacillus lactis 154]